MKDKLSDRSHIDELIYKFRYGDELKYLENKEKSTKRKCA